MKISDRDKKLILFVLLAAVIALPIFFFIRPKANDIKALDAELVSLNERYTYMKGLSEKQHDYELKIEELNAERDKIIAEYAGGVLTENTIMFLRGIEKAHNEDVMHEKFIADTIAFADDEETPITEASVNDQGEYVEGLTALKSSATIDYYGEYPDMRDVIKYIFDYQDKMVLSTVEMKLDRDTNLVSGTVILDQYAILGNGKEVKQTAIPNMLHGAKDGRLFDLVIDEETKKPKNFWSANKIKRGDEDEEEAGEAGGEDL